MPVYIVGCLFDSGIRRRKNSPAQILYPGESHQFFDGPEDWFTGDVRVEVLFPANDTAHYGGAYVTFQPGARSAWHLHPAGQNMIVTSGVGLTGTRDGKVFTIKVGDALWCPPDIDHWHGATPDSPMTHLVLTGVLDGKNAVWEYQAFNADKSLNEKEDLIRCFRCHKSEEQKDFVYTFDDMKNAK